MSTIADVPMTPAELDLAKVILGPWLIGSFVDVLLQGVLFCQFGNYLLWHHNDSLGTRLQVLGLAIITTLKTIHSFVSNWIMFILHFQNITGAISLLYNTWWLSGSGLMVATIGLYVQAFFCQRLWIISRRNPWFLMPIVAVLAFAYVSICLATYYILVGLSAAEEIGVWFAAHLSSVFVGDVMITFSTAYFLIKSRRDVLPQTVGVIDALVRLTFQTAAPAAICAMFNLVFSQIYPGGSNLISSAFNQALPKLYAFSMMWTLSARRGLRADDMNLVLSQDAHVPGWEREGNPLTFTTRSAANTAIFTSIAGDSRTATSIEESTAPSTRHLR